MSYIDRNILPGEQIIFRTKKHLIIFFYPLLITLIALYAYDYMHKNAILTQVEWAPSLIALIYAGSVLLEYVTSEFAVTNKRVMMREGFFYRHANEVRINTISQVNVDQTLLGQWLGYGMVSINTFGAFDAYTMIANPMAFQRSVNEQLDQNTK
jgi:uncharacterized membrane protein YdbT with pleckstrin-like domain